MSLTSFCVKYKRILCFIVFIILAFVLINVSSSIKEGLAIDWNKMTPVKTTCHAAGSNSCSKCTNSYIKYTDSADNILCDWNRVSNTCESSSSTTPQSYFSCPPTTSPPPTNSGPPTNPPTNTGPPPTNSVTACPSCSNLKLLDTPTWITTST